MALVGACERVGIDLDQIEDIAAGCVNPAHEGMGDVARWAALAAGFPTARRV
jgi:acetyl-CoA acetyltransferase